MKPKLNGLGASSACWCLWEEFCASSFAGLTFEESFSAEVMNGFVRVLDVRIWEGFGTVMGSFVCFFNRASEFDKIHIYCMSSSMMNVVAGLVRVSFVEWSTSVLLWYMLHVSSAKPWNLFGFTFITLLIFLFAWNFTFCVILVGLF